MSLNEGPKNVIDNNGEVLKEHNSVFRSQENPQSKEKREFLENLENRIESSLQNIDFNGNSNAEKEAGFITNLVNEKLNDVNINIDILINFILQAYKKQEEVDRTIGEFFIDSHISIQELAIIHDNFSTYLHSYLIPSNMHVSNINRYYLNRYILDSVKKMVVDQELVITKGVPKKNFWNGLSYVMSYSEPYNPYLPVITIKDLLEYIEEVISDRKEINHYIQVSNYINRIEKFIKSHNIVT